MTADTSTPLPRRYWSPRTGPRSAPPVFSPRPTTAPVTQTTDITDDRPLTLRQRLANATKAFTTNRTTLYAVGLNLAVALFLYLLGRPSVTGHVANFLQRCAVC
jgi:hypothetical protein